MARRRRGRLWRPAVLRSGDPGERSHREAAGGGRGALRTARETAVIIRRGDDYLLLHRAIDDYWHVVAGVVEEGETFAEAAARELREETGLDAVVIDVRMPQSYRVPEMVRDEYLDGVDLVVVENFTIEVPAGWEPVLNEEHDRYRWLSSEDAIAIAHWPETREILTAVARSRLSS